MWSKVELGGGDDGLMSSPVFCITRELRSFKKIFDSLDLPKPPILILPFKLGRLVAKYVRDEAFKLDLVALHIKEDDAEITAVYQKGMISEFFEYTNGSNDVQSAKQDEPYEAVELGEGSESYGKCDLEEVKDKENDIKDVAQPINKEKRDVESDSEEVKDEGNDIKELSVALIPEENVPREDRTFGVENGHADDFSQADDLLINYLLINLPIESFTSIMLLPDNNESDISVVFKMEYTDSYGNKISQTVYLQSLSEFLKTHNITFHNGTISIGPARKAFTSQASTSEVPTHEASINQEAASKIPSKKYKSEASTSEASTSEAFTSEASTSEASTNQEAASASKIPSKEHKSEASTSEASTSEAFTSEASTSEASTNQEAASASKIPSKEHKSEAATSEVSTSIASTNQETASGSKIPSKKYKSKIPLKKYKNPYRRRSRNKFTQTAAEDDASPQDVSQASNNDYDVPDIREKMGHVIELYGFPREEFTTNTFLNIYKKEPRYVKWCDGKTVVLVTGSVKQANEFLRIKHKLVKSRPITLASAVAVKMAEQLPPAGKVKSMTWSRSQQIPEEED